MSKKTKAIMITLVIFFILAGVIAVLYFLYKEDDKLLEKGYTKEESVFLEQKLTSEQLEMVANTEYQKDLLTIVNDPNFESKNLNHYLTYLEEDLEISKLISVVNQNPSLISNLKSDPNFESKNLNYYLTYLEEDLEISKLISVVNHNPSLISNLKKEDYYIPNKLYRYIDYSLKKDLPVSSIITNINSNLDFAFYTNTVSADLSKDTLVLVNKYYKLDENYKPNDLVLLDSSFSLWGSLRTPAYEALKALIAASLEDGMRLINTSPFRDYKLQTTLYNNRKRAEGQSQADKLSARPGFSEHQTGLALDFITPQSPYLEDFYKSKECQWLKDNSYKYGFILRYPEGKEYITGYQYEPWHYRFVGKEVAKKIYEKDITFEEYYAYYIAQ